MSFEQAQAVMEEIKETVHSETVIGEPVHAGDSVVIPVSRVSFGFGAGGGSGEDGVGERKGGSGIGIGAGATIEPVAFVVVSGGKAQILPIKSREATLTRVIDLIPSFLEFFRDTIEGRKEKDDSGTETGTEPAGGAASAHMSTSEAGSAGSCD